MDERMHGPGGRRFLGALTELAASRGKKVEDINIKAEVGSIAGEIYKVLEGKGEVNLRDVRESLAARGPLFAVALGWLLREDKIDVRASGEGIKVKLR